jgi:prophage DNA circulation protein
MADTLTDAKAFRFKDLDLSGNLVSWNDKIGMRLAVHQYLKRDGGEVENMGSEPGRFVMRLCFLGDQWAKQYRALVAAIRQDPRGQMVHPLLGTLRVACEGISDAAVSPAAERDSINLSISFVEDAVDATVVAEGFVGPAARQGQISSLATQVTTAISQIASAASAGAVLTGAAISFAAAAVAAASSDTPDPSLDQKIAGVVTSASAAITAVRADPRAGTDATTYALVALIEQLQAECMALAEAVAASKPTIVAYVVAGTTDIATLAARLYGADALARVDELLTLNRIPDPHAIPAGMVLRVAAPTL